MVYTNLMVIKKQDGTVSSGKTGYTDIDKALKAFYAYMSEHMTPVTMYSVSGVILDELCNVIKQDSWVASIQPEEDQSQSTDNTTE